jgi:TolA-binding protein
MYKYLIILISISIVLFSCNDDKAKAKLKADIKTEEQKLFSKEGIYKWDSKKADKLIDLYTSYSTKFPKDSTAPEFLFRSAELCVGSQRYKDAIAKYDLIIATYPDYKKTPVCMFLAGFNYENNMYDLKNAKKYYETFIAKYPNDPLVNDVKISLQNLGKSPEEIIKEFEKKNAVTQ